MINRGPIQLRPIAVVAAIATLFTAMQGLSYPLLAVVLDRRGAQSGFIGLNTAMMPLGMILAAPLAAPLMHRIGGRALAAISILAAVVGFMMIGAITNPWAWMPLRLLLGFSLACLFVVSDTWMIELATEEVRGRVHQERAVPEQHGGHEESPDQPRQAADGEERHRQHHRGQQAEAIQPA